MNNETNPHRIHLLGDGRQEEDIAGGAILPGHLLATTSAAKTSPNACGTVVKHATAGGASERKFALEDALQGKTIDDAYAEGDIVASVQCVPGDVVYAWLSEGAVVTPASFLTSNGDGTLKVATGSDVIVGKALEDVDASDSAGEGDNRVRVRIL